MMSHSNTLLYAVVVVWKLVEARCHAIRFVCIQVARLFVFAISVEDR